MRVRALNAALLGLLIAVSAAAPALADNGGEGLYGKADDKVITNFGMGLVVFFAVLVCTLSAIQYLLERRKTRR